MRPKANERGKKDIVENWLPRYTGTPLAEFGEYILLTNFDNYVEWFAALPRRSGKGHGSTDAQRDCRWNHSDQLSAWEARMPRPVMDLLSAIAPKSRIVSWQMRRIETQKNKVGDLILPIAGHSGRRYLE